MNQRDSHKFNHLALTEQKFIQWAWAHINPIYKDLLDCNILHAEYFQVIQDSVTM